MKQTPARIHLAELITDATHDEVNGEAIVELLDTPAGHAALRGLADAHFKEAMTDLMEKWYRFVEAGKRSRR